mmetsp:Transcript_21044/g.72582  ORF Transcript_21044/g.72582 Transcript_21044/m.72582 type:complete len:99 (-) Transcript_21044:244-540(-)
MVYINGDGSVLEERSLKDLRWSVRPASAPRAGLAGMLANVFYGLVDAALFPLNIVWILLYTIVAPPRGASRRRAPGAQKSNVRSLKDTTGTITGAASC